MEKNQSIDLVHVIMLRQHEFVSKFNQDPTDIILPLFLKTKLSRNVIPFDYSRLMGMRIHWTMIDNVDAIQVFNSI